jgi:hypothetical protein
MTFDSHKHQITQPLTQFEKKRVDNIKVDPPHPLTRLAFPKRLLDGMLIQDAMRVFPLFPKILQVIISSFLISLTHRSLSNSYRSFGLFQQG